MDKLSLSDKHLVPQRPSQLVLQPSLVGEDALLLTVTSDRRIGERASIYMDKEMALELLSFLERWSLDQPPVE